MEKQVMVRKSSDNPYFHKDFHVSCDLGLTYLGQNYGDQIAKEYIQRYANSYLSPLSAELEREGTAALERYLCSLYDLEHALEQLEIERDETKISVKIHACPAVAFMKSAGYQVSKWYAYTTSVLYETVADRADMDFSLDYYDPETGAAKFCLCRRENERT